MREGAPFMRLKKYIFFVIILAVSLVSIWTDADYAATHKKVLIINSYHHGLSWTDDTTEAEIEKIKSVFNGDVKIYVEYMDWKEYPTTESMLLFKELMKYKYETMKIDLIIASDDAAFEFSLEHRDTIFGDVPIVFHGISESSYKNLVSDEENLTGVLEIVDIKATLEMAKMVNPNLEKFYIIYDETESGRAMGTAAAIEVHNTLPEVEVIKITNISIEDIISFVSTLDNNDNILMTAYYTDIHGNNINFEDMIQKVSDATPAAVFSLYDFALGKGAIGGNLLSGTLIGERAGELAIEILNGAEADQLEIVRDNIHINAIDYSAAIDYNIDFKMLSDDVVVLNRPVSLFETYRRPILLAIIVMSAMALFLVLLSYYLRKTVKLKNELAEKNVEQKILYDEIMASEEELKAQYEALNDMFEELNESKEKNELILNVIKDAIIDWNIRDDSVSASESWNELIGLPSEQITDSNAIFKWIHEDDLESIKTYYMQEFNEETKDFVTQIRINTKEGVYKWFLVKGVIARDSKGIPTRMVSSYTDIDAIRQMEDQIRYAAFHDEMTGYPNKKALETKVSNDIKKGLVQFGIMLIDIDHFKRINDTMGHRFGDNYIKEVGSILKSHLIPESEIFRISGDEFVVYHRMQHIHEFDQLSNRLVNALNNVIQVEYSNFSNSVSIGAAVYPTDGDSLESLITRADLAMYKAKENGRGRVVRYENTMLEKRIWRIEREEALKTALKQGELSLAYQPQVNCLTNEIVGFEALLRWYHPILGHVPPLDFIPIAEESQLIMPIGKWVIDEALSFLSMMNKRYNKSFHMAVNVSVLQLIQDDFEIIIEEALESNSIDSNHFVVEITESVVIQAMDSVSSKLKRLQNRGIRVALDDFGTGYSSLSYLKTLPVDILKIDKSFIDEMVISKSQEDLVQLIIQIGRQMTMTLVAEGVESQEQLELLKIMNCDFMQGYYYSKPLTELECMKKLDQVITG